MTRLAALATVVRQPGVATTGAVALPNVDKYTTPAEQLYAARNGGVMHAFIEAGRCLGSDEPSYAGSATDERDSITGSVFTKTAGLTLGTPNKWTMTRDADPLETLTAEDNNIPADAWTVIVVAEPDLAGGNCMLWGHSVRDGGDGATMLVLSNGTIRFTDRLSGGNSVSSAAGVVATGTRQLIWQSWKNTGVGAVGYSDNVTALATGTMATTFGAAAGEQIGSSGGNTANETGGAILARIIVPTYYSDVDATLWQQLITDTKTRYSVA